MHLRSKSVFSSSSEIKENKNSKLEEFKNKSASAESKIHQEMTKLQKIIDEFIVKQDELYRQQKNESPTVIRPDDIFEAFFANTGSRYTVSRDRIIADKLKADARYFEMTAMDQFSTILSLIQDFSFNILEEKINTSKTKDDKKDNDCLKSKITYFEECFKQRIPWITISGENNTRSNEETRKRIIKEIPGIFLGIKEIIKKKIEEKEVIISTPKIEENNSCIIC